MALPHPALVAFIALGLLGTWLLIGALETPPPRPPAATAAPR